jgi:hypothetical protein
MPLRGLDQVGDTHGHLIDLHTQEGGENFVSLSRHVDKPPEEQLLRGFFSGLECDIISKADIPWLTFT